MTWPALIGAQDMSGADRLLRVIEALAEAFADLAAGRTRSPSRTIIEHGPGRQLVVGPAVWERRGMGSVKITTLTPDNLDRGLPLIDGVVVLTDMETGQIAALLAGGELTAIRTGAVAGLATRLCAPQEAQELAVIGAGVQARALARAMFAVRPIRSVRVFSRTRARALGFAEWVSETAGRSVTVTVCDTAKAAVADAAVICTATSTGDRTPLVQADWVAPGTHINVIGGTCEDAIEVDPALLATAFVVVEAREAALEEAGEVRAALADGLIGVDKLHELGTLMNGATEKHTLRASGTTNGRTSLFRCVGMAIEDTAAAVALYEAVSGAGRASARLAAANQERSLEHDNGLPG